MKSMDTIENVDGLWNEPNYSATNVSGFSALPAGEYGRGNIGLFSIEIDNGAKFWINEEVSMTTASNFFVMNNNSYLQRFQNRNKARGTSVRCIKD